MHGLSTGTGLPTAVFACAFNVVSTLVTNIKVYLSVGMVKDNSSTVFVLNVVINVVNFINITIGCPVCGGLLGGNGGGCTFRVIRLTGRVDRGSVWEDVSIGGSRDGCFGATVHVSGTFLRLLRGGSFTFVAIGRVYRDTKMGHSAFCLRCRAVRSLLSRDARFVCGRFMARVGRRPDSLVSGVSAYPLSRLCLVVPGCLVPCLRCMGRRHELFHAIARGTSAFQLSLACAGVFCRVFRPVLGQFNIPRPSEGCLVAFCVRNLGTVVAR